MTDIERITYSLEHHDGKTAMVFPRTAWNALVLESGKPTLLASAPSPLKEVERSAAVVAIAASGLINPDPGIDVVRHDPEDAPYVYNLDHYKVIENLQLHPQYDALLKTACVNKTDSLDAALKEHVFIVGPYDKGCPVHWVKEIPDHIAKARSKLS